MNHPIPIGSRVFYSYRSKCVLCGRKKKSGFGIIDGIEFAKGKYQYKLKNIRKRLSENDILELY